ncbi:hypothetical protein TSOC_009558 [Tetrabaena socialis]|uniref:Uncharacterized protein n=1 Tax=Tetrabaena socialis TaxID=47790 RepID=A0A2J7ZVI3_9CHLO|nr:hypothetical protein TSOC_009558 [Tetrabaena socialis]|eukprot:PNH04291.1 hypothetical protein TSOC_009558 [Tetrabaena socialis]
MPTGKVRVGLQAETGRPLFAALSGGRIALERSFQSAGGAAAFGFADAANRHYSNSAEAAASPTGSDDNALLGVADGPGCAAPADSGHALPSPAASSAASSSHAPDPSPTGHHAPDHLASSAHSPWPSSHGLDPSNGALDLAPPCPVAYATLEDSIALFLSPPQLGAQLWEGVHSATGLPWWAAIPAGTLAVRAALLPLSLRAYAASSNIALLHSAVGLARRASEAVSAGGSGSGAASASEGGEGGVTAGNSVGSSIEGGSSGEAAAGDKAAAGGSGGGGAGNVQPLGRVALVRGVLAQLRAARGAPGFGWYLGNAAVQASLALALTLALRRMSDSLWPGLTAEGLLYFTDLTAPPVYLHTLSTPFGTAGAILPLALVLLYVSAVDKSAGGSSPGISTALKLLALPLYCAALLQPHAVLLYWTSHAATQLGMYAAAERLPALRRAAGAPEMLMRREVDSQEPPLDEVLLGLAESYGNAGNTTAARACLEAVLARQPGHKAADERLQRLPPA